MSHSAATVDPDLPGASTPKSLGVEDRRAGGSFHDLNRVRAVAPIDVAFTASCDLFAVRRVVDPIPPAALILFLPIAGIGYLCHVSCWVLSLGDGYVFGGHFLAKRR